MATEFCLKILKFLHFSQKDSLFPALHSFPDYLKTVISAQAGHLSQESEDNRNPLCQTALILNELENQKSLIELLDSLADSPNASMKSISRSLVSLCQKFIEETLSSSHMVLTLEEVFSLFSQAEEIEAILQRNSLADGETARLTGCLCRQIGSPVAMKKEQVLFHIRTIMEFSYWSISGLGSIEKACSLVEKELRENLKRAKSKTTREVVLVLFEGIFQEFSDLIFKKAILSLWPVGQRLHSGIGINKGPVDHLSLSEMEKNLNDIMEISLKEALSIVNGVETFRKLVKPVQKEHFDESKALVAVLENSERDGDLAMAISTELYEKILHKFTERLYQDLNPAKIRSLFEKEAMGNSKTTFSRMIKRHLVFLKESIKANFHNRYWRSLVLSRLWPPILEGFTWRIIQMLSCSSWDPQSFKECILSETDVIFKEIAEFNSLEGIKSTKESMEKLAIVKRICELNLEKPLALKKLIEDSESEEEARFAKIILSFKLQK